MILGFSPEQLSMDLVLHHWRKQMKSPGVHPDLGGDQEAATYLNTAKETLIKWISENPNRGFQGKGDGPNQPSGVPRKPLPAAGSGAIALPLPDPEPETET